MRGLALTWVGLLASLPLLALSQCDRKETASTAASASVDPSKAADRWIDTLDPAALGSLESRTPDAVLRALAERRKGKAPLVAPPAAEAARDKARASADKLLDRGYSLRKNPAWKPKPPIDWGKNPNGDSNWHYNVNSLRQLKPLIEAYQAGAGDKYLAIARNVALDWIEYNMIQNRPNEKKWHDMGTAFRGQCLATILDLELRRAKPDRAAVARLVWALDEHAAFLADPKVFTLGNHGFFMMRGLSWVLRTLPELRRRPEAERYIDNQMKRLIASQFARDGLHLEHSPGYHTFITASFAEAVSDGSFPRLAELNETVQRAKTHFEELRHPNGDLAMLGDTERGVGDKQSSTEPHRGDSSLRAYPESGYVVFRSHFGEQASETDDYLLLGAGHHSNVHKHADHLSFEWSFGGVPILIDSGKYTYNKDKWRRFFVSTRAGNAVEVDESDYATRPGKGKYKSKLGASGQLGEAYYIVAEQRDQELAVGQTRVLLIHPGRYLLVVDQMRSKKEHTYRQWFHFHESLEVEASGERVFVRNADAALLTVRELSDASEAELVRGQTQPRIQGFVSSKYMQKTPRYSLAFRRRGTNATWATLFSPGEVQAVQVTEDEAGFRVAWRDARGAQGLRYERGAEEPVKPLAP